MKMISLKQTYSKMSLTTMIASLFVMIGTLSSCDNFLTDDPKSQLRIEDAYNSIDKLKKNALLTVYNYIGGHEDSQGLQGTERGVYDLNSFTTDEQIIPLRGSDWFDGGLWFRLFFHLWDAGEAPFKATWDYLYKVVSICNEGIEHMEEYETDDESELKKLASYTAELRAVRAMYYFYLMDLYGRVPLVTSTDIKSTEMTLCERRDLFHWIYNELNEALPYLYIEFSQLPNTEYYGRMTVFVAYFVMMKMAINAEIYTDNNWTDNVYPDGKDIMLKTLNCFSYDYDEANAWETVRIILNNIKSFYYLSDNYCDNFDVGNENSRENIFVIPMDPLLYSNQYNYFKRSRHYCHGAALGGSGENGPCATISSIKTFGYSEDEDVLPDGRFNSNFYYGVVYAHGKDVYEDDGETPLFYHPLAVTEYDLSRNEYEKTAGARIAKYTIDATMREDGRLGSNDIVLFRYADALLMYAEASYRLGDMENALGALNEVHHRANRTRYNKIDEDILLRERLMELMWEGWRRNDLIRFRRFHKPYDIKEESTFEEDAHTTVFPIPADMMVMHPNWKQNYGY